jgi:hypothetical protein
MIMYKKLDCECGHEYYRHSSKCNTCFCEVYNPAGHNPELENVLCPRCKLVRLERVDRHYICVACQYVMLESQVLELVG